MHTFQPLPFDLVEFNPFYQNRQRVGARHSRQQGKSQHDDRKLGRCRCPLGQNVAFIFVRDSRYTKEFIDANEFFSITFLSGQYRDALNYCGSHSGRDEDKFAAAGLTLATRHNIPLRG